MLGKQLPLCAGCRTVDKSNALGYPWFDHDDGCTLKAFARNISLGLSNTYYICKVARQRDPHHSEISFSIGERNNHKLGLAFKIET